MNLGDRIPYLYVGEDYFECHITAKKNLLFIIFVGLLLLVKLPVTHIGFLFQAVSIIYIFWFVIYALLWSFLAIIWIWNVFGKEIVKVEEDILSIKHNVFGLGKIKIYPLKDISNIGISEFHNITMWFSNFIFWNMGSGVIAFDYKGETYRFGMKLGERESSELVKILKKYLEQHSTHNYHSSTPL